MCERIEQSSTEGEVRVTVEVRAASEASGGAFCLSASCVRDRANVCVNK